MKKFKALHDKTAWVLVKKDTKEYTQLSIRLEPYIKKGEVLSLKEMVNRLNSINWNIDLNNKAAKESFANFYKDYIEVTYDIFLKDELTEIKKISVDTFRTITGKSSLDGFVICKVCSGEFKTEEEMYQYYKDKEIVVTMDMFVCPKCKVTYSSGSYKSRKSGKILLFIENEIVELVG